MIKKISFVVCLLLVLDVYACKYMPSPCENKLIKVETCPSIRDDMACARLDPKFKDFENFFDVEKVRSDRRLDSRCEDIGKSFTFYVTPKVKIPFENIIFKFEMTFVDSLFKKSPIDAVESFKKMAAAIHKNPSFEKWLEKNAKERAEGKKTRQLLIANKFLVMSDQEELIYENIAVIKNQKDIHVGGKSWYDSDEPIENAWNKIVKSGKYIGTLAFCEAPDFCSRVEYCGSPYFLLGDNGDVFVPEIWLWNSKKEKILDVSQNEIDAIPDTRLKQCKVQKSSKGILSYVEDFLCNHSLASEKRCAEWRSKYYKTEYCDYIIIRNDGSIEYGPKSRDL